jgi:hypothetical protein
MHLSAETEHVSRVDAEGRTQPSPIWKHWLGALLLLAGLALTPVWIGVLGWLAYEFADALLKMWG